MSELSSGASRTLSAGELDAWLDGRLEEVGGEHLCPPPCERRPGVKYAARLVTMAESGATAATDVLSNTGE